MRRKLTFLPIHRILFLHERQTAVAVVLFLILILRSLFSFALIHDLPPRGALRAAACREELVLIGHAELRLVVLMHGIELREVAARDEVVEIALLGRHLRDVRLHRRRDNRMMR